MTGSVLIDNKRVELSATLGAMLRYKQQFGKEYNEDVSELNKFDENCNEEYYTKLTTTGIKLIWAMAKTADNSIPSFDIWVDTIGNIDIEPILTEAVALYSRSLGEHQSSQDITDDINSDFCTEELVALCVACGISVSDLDMLSVDMTVKIIKEIADLKGGKNNENEIENGGIRKATPEDIQAFFG